MNTQTCAVFAQVIPVLYLAVFIGNQRVTTLRTPKKTRLGMFVNYYFLAVLLAGGVAGMAAVYGAAFTAGVPVFFGYFILYATCALVSFMMIAALAIYTADKQSD